MTISRSVRLGSLMLSAAVMVAGAPAFGQEVSGVLGLPSATTTIPGNQIPAPAPKFGGVIKENATDSKPW
jgi:hypothetical protein